MSSVNSVLIASFRLNNRATNGNEASGSPINNDVEDNEFVRTKSNPNLNNCPILSRRVSENILETLLPRGTEKIIELF